MFCAGVGEKVWDCRLLVMEESGLIGAVKASGEVALWACDANVGLTIDADERAGGELFNISIRVGRVAGGEDGEDGDGAA